MLEGLSKDIGQVQGAVNDLRTDLMRQQQRLDAQTIICEPQFKTLSALITEHKAALGKAVQLEATITKSLENVDQSVTHIRQLREEHAVVTHAISRLEDNISSFQEKVCTTMEQQSADLISRDVALCDEVKQVRKGSDVKQVVEALEVKLREHVKESREAQAEVLRDQDHERAARAARSLNIRIVSLEEVEEEDTVMTVTDFFQGNLRVINPKVLQAAIIQGCSELWEGADFIALVETWETAETDALPEGFVKLTSLWNDKAGRKGRGYGGISVWVRDGLELDFQLEYSDPLKQFLCVRIGRGRTADFIVIAYFAPQGAPVYTRAGTKKEPFLELIKVVHKLTEGPVWVLGDFNSRTGSQQGMDLEDVDAKQWTRVADDAWPRMYRGKDTDARMFGRDETYRVP
ncbi:hypothetical protein R1sor_001057 [Riccia sorocarpa]|uniref:Endonuclease/exonuclease/phosphatase domain-containing protein n=1 Tax=Riccia sorocarpa TaxID=122646 RepID=A0ABD3GY45_9MARC